ncbi:MAG TPA: glycosyltransferase, partial [Polyangium sp.]|nr:glycosyltransferase [Polyangium sp.]
LGLTRAGHEARIVTTVDHKPLVDSYGLEMRAVNLDVRAALQGEKTSASIEGGGLIASFREFAEIAKRGAEMSAQVGLEASRGSDAILAGFGGVFIGDAIAAKLGITLVQAYNVPLSVTGAYGGALFPRLSWGERSRRFGHRLTREAIWMLMRSSGNTARMKLLGAPSAPLFAPAGMPGLVPGPVIYGYSNAVLPEMEEWGNQVEVTGFWFTDEPTDWTPPKALEEFLAAGSKPVCIGFGSMSQTAPEEATRLVLDAVARSGVRAVLLSGWGRLEAKERSDQVFQAEHLPHSWLYPRTRAIVHHGGAGTTAAALRAGVPEIVVPFHGDQFYWAKLVHDLGLGPEGIARTRLSAERLARALRTAVDDLEMARRAADMGARVRAEDGVGRAVQAMERIVAKGRH